MAEETDETSKARSRSGVKAGAKPGSRAGARAAKGGEDPQMGAALRSVYQKTVEEAVPDEMLDLLAKLG